MSFRKRNLVINRGQPPSETTSHISPTVPKSHPPGFRPSPINGQYTTSTGTSSLDSLLAGHAGLPLGCSLLIQEHGTTDFGGVLLRQFAAEGIIQGHAVTVVGAGAGWVRDLPAAVGDSESGSGSEASGDKWRERERMKIAWRYERLGDFGSGIGGSRAQNLPKLDPKGPEGASNPPSTAAVAFCHSFDLTKRLTIPSNSLLSYVSLPPQSLSSSPPTESSPLTPVITALTALIHKHPPALPHRIVIPSLLSPLLYPSSSSTPRNLLPFIHSLRALLRRHPQKLTIMMSLPLELYPRDTALVRWAEILSDGVVELTPLPQLQQQQKGVDQQAPQGLVKVWKLPVLGEKGGGVGALGAGEDLAFKVTRKRFEIQAHCLPPMDEDGGGAGGGGEGEGRATKVDIEF